MMGQNGKLVAVHVTQGFSIQVNLRNTFFICTLTLIRKLIVIFVEKVLLGKEILMFT